MNLSTLFLRLGRKSYGRDPKDLKRQERDNQEKE